MVDLVWMDEQWLQPTLIKCGIIISSMRIWCIALCRKPTQPLYIFLLDTLWKERAACKWWVQLRFLAIQMARYSCSWPAENREQLASLQPGCCLWNATSKAEVHACSREVQAISLPVLHMLPHPFALQAILRPVVDQRPSFCSTLAQIHGKESADIVPWQEYSSLSL